MKLLAKDIIVAYGHPNIKATHKTTFEVTKDTYLTPKGDCIIGIRADKALSDLSDKLKNALKRRDAIVKLKLKVDDIEDEVTAYGNPRLILSSKKDAVVRKSDYICERTLAIKADKAAVDIDRKLVEKLRRGKKLILEIAVFSRSS
ncbi:DUF371 domain-containing protein [archaeon]|nr:MAG: DUF371 domain-containing protein [archaeon]